MAEAGLALRALANVMDDSLAVELDGAQAAALAQHVPVAELIKLPVTTLFCGLEVAGKAVRPAAVFSATQQLCAQLAEDQHVDSSRVVTVAMLFASLLKSHEEHVLISSSQSQSSHDGFGLAVGSKSERVPPPSHARSGTSAVATSATATQPAKPPPVSAHGAAMAKEGTAAGDAAASQTAGIANQAADGSMTAPAAGGAAAQDLTTT